MAALDKSTFTEIEFNTDVQTMEQQHDASKPSSRKTSASTSSANSLRKLELEDQLKVQRAKQMSSMTKKFV